jgi:hypothetical protein
VTWQRGHLIFCQDVSERSGISYFLEGLEGKVRKDAELSYVGLIALRNHP